MIHPPDRPGHVVQIEQFHRTNATVRYPYGKRLARRRYKIEDLARWQHAAPTLPVSNLFNLGLPPGRPERTVTL